MMAKLNNLWLLNQPSAKNNEGFAHSLDPVTPKIACQGLRGGSSLSNEWSSIARPHFSIFDMAARSWLSPAREGHLKHRSLGYLLVENHVVRRMHTSPPESLFHRAEYDLGRLEYF